MPRIGFFILALHIFHNSIVLDNVSGALGKIDITGWENVYDDKRKELQQFVNNDAQLQVLESVVGEWSAVVWRDCIHTMDFLFFSFSLCFVIALLLSVILFLLLLLLL